MRARKFGLSNSLWAPQLSLLHLSLTRPSLHIHSAVEDYKKQRQNGTDEDNPERPFPEDGVYGWVREKDIAHYLKLPPKPNHYRCRYTQGPLDKAWMEERDRNYLARRAREEGQQQGAGASSTASSPSP